MKGTKYLNFNKTKNEVSQFFYVASTLSRVDQQTFRINRYSKRMDLRLWEEKPPIISPDQDKLVVHISKRFLYIENIVS